MLEDKLKTEKTVVIVNGKGGAGKDTVCDIVRAHYNARVISAITPIKEIAGMHGWNGEKDAKGRKLLSDLKRAFIDYNDLPTAYLEAEYRKFMDSGDDILLVHIREGDQIDAFKRRVRSRCLALLIRRTPEGGDKLYGNESDDNVEDYDYDFHYVNDKPLEEVETDFLAFFEKLLTANTSI